MVNVYLDTDGAVRSTASGKVIAPAGTTPAAARMQARLWAEAASVLSAATAAPPHRGEGMAAVAAPTPITAAPSYARTVPAARRVLAVIDIEQLAEETAWDLAAISALTAHSPAQEDSR